MKIGFTANPTTLIEDQKTVFTLTFTLDQLPPPEGILVTIDSDAPRALAELDVFAATFTGARLTGANSDSSGLTLRITQQTATIALPVFDDNTEEGTDRFTYTLQPSSTYTIDPNASTVTLTIQDREILPVNNPPVANSDSYSATAGTALTVVLTNGVLANDTDPDGNTLTASVITAPTNGTVNFNSNGTFVYTPNANFSGTDRFTYQANDGTASSNSATVSLTVSSPLPPGAPTGAILGTAGSDRLNGTAKNDRIEGLNGNDRIAGLGGNDLLLGGNGADQITGGAGSDRLLGGTGNNRLTGNQGRDLFVLESGTGQSLITDFENGRDRLGLSLSLSFRKLDISQRGNSTVIRNGNDTLAILRGEQASQITAADFSKFSAAS
jgi:Ca2+-binding RTX toxin-like protein